MEAVILAAGKGKRMTPLTEDMPKALLQVNNKPIIDHILENLKKAGITKITVVVGHKGIKIKKHLNKKQEINFIWQRKPQGTAHALQQIKIPDKDFLVTAGDTILPAEFYKKIIRYHQQGSQDITVALKKLTLEEMKESSTVKIKNNEIIEITEKPTEKEIHSTTACAPLYILPPESSRYVKETRKSSRGEYEITDTLQKMINDGFIIKGLTTREWKHITTPKDLGTR